MHGWAPLSRCVWGGRQVKNYPHSSNYYYCLGNPVWPLRPITHSCDHTGAHFALPFPHADKVCGGGDAWGRLCSQATKAPIYLGAWFHAQAAQVQNRPHAPRAIHTRPLIGCACTVHASACRCLMLRLGFALFPLMPSHPVLCARHGPHYPTLCSHDDLLAPPAGCAVLPGAVDAHKRAALKA